MKPDYPYMEIWQGDTLYRCYQDLGLAVQVTQLNVTPPEEVIGCRVIRFENRPQSLEQEYKEIEKYLQNS